MADAKSRFPEDDGLGDALRALPLAHAEHDGWPTLAAALQARRAPARRSPRRWHWLAGAGLAASLLLAALLPWSTQAPLPVVAEQQPAATEPMTELAWMQRRSSELEAWLAELPTPPVRDGRSALARIEIEDLIGLVDLQLDASRSADEALPLWRQRVDLLEDLSMLRGASFGYANAAAAAATAEPSAIL